VALSPSTVIHTDLILTSAHSLTGSFADIAGMTDVVSVEGPDSVILLQMSLQAELPGNDEVGEYRFTHDGARVGPVVSAFADDTDRGNGLTLMFALTGLSAGNHTFAVQGQNRVGTSGGE